MSMKALLFALLGTLLVVPAVAEEMTLKEMTEDSLRRTIELSDRVREADLRARDQLGSAEISQTPETTGSSGTDSSSPSNHK